MALKYDPIQIIKKKHVPNPWSNTTNMLLSHKTKHLKKFVNALRF